ncbi:hypothetical protein QE152_g25577 [Popillia japonica]|uniref:Uncharacterized protein n=1 Tax=Popillia japonica TaxID=7064 RepID=A0AAW1K0M8_POPJA
MPTNTSPELLCSATQTSLTKNGKRRAAQVVVLSLTTSPPIFKRMKQIHDNPSCCTAKPYSPEEAMAPVIDTDLGKRIIFTYKKQCYPSNIKISETEVQIPVQDILNHAIQRLAYVQQDVLLLHHDHASNIPIQVTYKWGLDGSGGHSIYKQCFANNSMYADTNIILCAIVPLQMCEVNAKGKQIFWQNPYPSSSRYSLIIRLQIQKEAKEAVKLHYQATEEEILRLYPTQVTLADKCYTFQHLPVCTMMDGKTCNVLTDTSSSPACNVCKATPKQLNNLDLLLKKQYSTTSSNFGISILHSSL